MISVKPLIYFFGVVVFFMIYGFAPLGVSEWIIWLSLIVFYLVWIERYKNDSRAGFFGIEFLFLSFVYLIYFYPYQLYVFGLFDLVSTDFLQFVYLEYANKSITLSMVGFLSFCLGGFFVNKNILCWPSSVSFKYLPKVILSLFLLCLSLFLITGLKNMIAGAYQGSDVGTTSENGIYFLVTHFSLLSIATWVYYRYRNIRVSMTLRLALSLSILWSIFLLFVGDRNMFFILAVAGGAGYFTFVRPPSKIVLLGLVMASFLLYSVVEVTRKAESKTVSGMVDALLADSQDTKKQLGGGSFYLSTITTRVAHDLVPENIDYFYGKFKVIGFLGVIPFSRSLIVEADDPYVTSADLFTEGILGPSSSWSLGTNVISDIFVDFGPVGVVLLMFMMGWFGRYVSNQAFSPSVGIAPFVTYLVTLALYSQAARYAFDFPVRNVVWTILLFAIYSKAFKGVVK